MIRQSSAGMVQDRVSSAACRDFLKAGFGLGDGVVRAARHRAGGAGRWRRGPGAAQNAVFEGEAGGGVEFQGLAEAAGNAAVGLDVAAEEAVAARHGQVEDGGETPPARPAKRQVTVRAPTRA